MIKDIFYNFRLTFTEFIQKLLTNACVKYNLWKEKSFVDVFRNLARYRFEIF